MEKIKFIDLFAGLGGTRIGFEEACKDFGIESECVFTSEIKPYAVDIYKHNFSDEEVSGDITKINERDVPDFDFLLGGFPCQAFSTAGKKAGFNDARGTLFFDVARIIKEKKPKGFLLENVEGLVNHDKKKKNDAIGNTLQVIIKILEDLGYYVNWIVLNAENFGVPQIRKRIYITGSLKSEIKLSNFHKTSKVFNDIREKNLPPLNTDFTKIGNLIITGNVISKKQEFIKSYLIFLVSKFNLDDIRLIIDDSTGALNKFGDIPHLLAPIINNTDKSLPALRWLLREMDRRIDKHNKDESEKFPVIVYIGSIFNIYSVEIEDTVKRLSSMGAYAGIHLMLTGDRLGDFPKMIKDNIPAKLDFDRYGEPVAVFSFKNKKNIKLSIFNERKVDKYLKSMKQCLTK